MREQQVDKTFKFLLKLYDKKIIINIVYQTRPTTTLTTTIITLITTNVCDLK